MHFLSSKLLAVLQRHHAVLVNVSDAHLLSADVDRLPVFQIASLDLAVAFLLCLLKIRILLALHAGLLREFAQPLHE